MAQYGQSYGQQPGQQPSAPTPPPPPGGAAAGSGGHGKRRMYPQQQYDFSAQQQPGGGIAPQAYGAPVDPAQAQYGVQPGVGTPGVAPQAPGVGGVFTPGVATAPAVNAQQHQPQQPQYGVNQLGAQFGNMNVQNEAPRAGGYQQQNSITQVPLNKLFNVDLMANLPPPISDLQLPPTPLVIPPEASVTESEGRNSSHDYIRSTLNCIPQSNALLKKSKLPFALVIRPYNALLNANENVPVVSDTVICRCRRCRCYINPFVTFLDQTHRWKCNMCGLTNEVPSQFDWDPIKNERQNRYERNEINYGVCEFVAPPEYMVRPPQPPVYVFVIDTSVNAVQNGLLATAARTIKESLDRIPNKDGRTRVGFIAVDSALHYFSIPLPSNANAEPSVLVVSDLDDPFLPLPSSLLVNLAECRDNIDKLLDDMNEMFANNVNSSNALGSALQAANKLIGSIGGKIICITANIPNAGVAKLEAREDRKILGTSKEHSLLQPGNAFYRTFAVDCNKSQVTVDMFLFCPQYQDVATLSNLPRFTGGQTYFYPGWSASRPEDAIKFAHELGEHLSQEISMEAVLRVRASTGLRMNAFYGNFFNRSSDLCSFPTFPRDQSYVVEVALDENITKPWVCLQAGILHTTCDGERRIRVLTVAIPTSANLQDIYASADQLAITSYLTHKAYEKALSGGIASAQELLTSRLTDMLQTYKKELMTTNVGASSPLQFCVNLRMLPLLVNALIKHVGFRKSSQIPSDLRSAALALLTTLPVPYLIKYIYPDFFALHELGENDGVPDAETGQIQLPVRLNLSGERIASHGLYLLDDGQTQFLWVGRDAVPALLEDAFGVSSLAEVRGGKTELPETGTELNERIRAIVGKLREKKDNITWPHLYIVKDNDDPALRLWFTTHLVEDRADPAVSYPQFLTQLRDKLNN